MKSHVHLFGCVILLSFLLNGCKDVEHVQSLGEFDIPLEPGVAQRIYTYVRQPGGDTIVHNYIFTDSVRNRYWRITKENSVTTGESLYEFQNNRKKLITEYTHQPLNSHTIHEKVKGEILQYEEQDIGHRFTGIKTIIRFTNSEGFSNLLIEEDNSIKEIAEDWQGEKNRALEIDYTVVIKEQIKFLPFFGHEYTYHGKVVFMEGIGLFKWTVKSDGEIYETKLLSTKVIKL